MQCVSHLMVGDRSYARACTGHPDRNVLDFSRHGSCERPHPLQFVNDVNSLVGTDEDDNIFESFTSRSQAKLLIDPDSESIQCTVRTTGCSLHGMDTYFGCPVNSKVYSLVVIVVGTLRRYLAQRHGPFSLSIARPRRRRR